MPRYQLWLPRMPTHARESNTRPSEVLLERAGELASPLFDHGRVARHDVCSVTFRWDLSFDRIPEGWNIVLHLEVAVQDRTRGSPGGSVVDAMTDDVRAIVPRGDVICVVHFAGVCERQMVLFAPNIRVSDFDPV